MAKLGKVEADQLMEKFSKLVPTGYAGGTPPTLTWRCDKHEMELNMYSYLTWTLESKKDNGRYYYETAGTLDFEAFPLWQRIRLRFFFKRIWREARAKDKADKIAARLAESLTTAQSILGRDDA